jgi:23S rRNA pseudouridine2605 synthase
MARVARRPPGHVALNRALSKLGAASRAAATRLIKAGRVRVDGRLALDPAEPVVPERTRLTVDGDPVARARWTTVVLNKPRGVVTTRHDPEGRPTVFGLVEGAGPGLVAAGRLDLATTGLLLLTSDTRLAAWITDPANHVARVYTLTVRGKVDDDTCRRLEAGIALEDTSAAAERVQVRKRSRRESHLVVSLREGRNREVRRLFETVGHEVTRLRRVALGGLDLGSLAPGRWRRLTPGDVRAAFPGAPVAGEAARRRSSTPDEG